MDLTLGSCDAATLQLELNRRITSFRDRLSLGPVRPFSTNSIERWVQRRASFWSGQFPIGTNDAARQESEYLRTIETIFNSKVITLWSATGVDGLVLAAWLTFVVHARNTNCQIELIQFPRRAGPHILNMSGEIIAKHPQSVPVVGATAEFLISFWQAWTAPSPCLLLELFANATSQHSRRFLLSLLLDRYPNAETGLSCWDQKMLRNVHEHGPRLRVVIAHALGDSFRSFDNVGDLWLRSRLIRLARSGTKGALVTIRRDDNNLLQEKVKLTPLGSDILAGRANALDFAIRTDWIGGVRITASNPTVWVRTSEGLAQRSTKY